jgi:hypothetical protein
MNNFNNILGIEKKIARVALVFEADRNKETGNI